MVIVRGLVGTLEIFGCMFVGTLVADFAIHIFVLSGAESGEFKLFLRVMAVFCVIVAVILLRWSFRHMYFLAHIKR
jgi:hypothetical protein